MSTLTIRNLDETVKKRLRTRAAEHGRSMEEEARTILRDAVRSAPSPTRAGIGTEIRALVTRYGAADDLVMPDDESASGTVFE